MSSERLCRGSRQVFICHAGGDKETVARPLATALSTLGASAWLDADQLKIGDRLRPVVDAALANSGSAVVIFSPSFYLSRWAALYEFDGIISRFVAGELLLLPILHDISRAEFRLSEPSLASCISRSTSEFAIDDIAKEIADVVLGSSAQSWCEASCDGQHQLAPGVTGLDDPVCGRHVRQRIHTGDRDHEFALDGPVGKARQVRLVATAGEGHAEATGGGVRDGDDPVGATS